MTVTALHPGYTNAAPMPPAAPAAVEVIYEPAPEGAPADAPRVFAAIGGVMRDAMPVGKDQKNTQQNYNFRGIDDVMSAMAGPMRTHGVFILPSIASHKQDRDGKMTRTMIMMRYRIYGPAGDCLIATVPGEAFDFADKATNKAQSAALKYLLFTLFMLPVDGRSIDDGDREHPVPEEHRAERQQNQQRRNQRQQQNGQQRNQQRQQQGGQQQRPNRGGPDPTAQQGANRDYLAEAAAATSPQAFDKVRAEAAAAGAPPEFLARLDAVAAQKKAAANRQQATAGGTTFVDPSVVVEDQEHAAALGEMYDAAKSAGLTREEADAVMFTHHKTAPQAATIAALRAQRDDLLDAARQNGATA